MRIKYLIFSLLTLSILQSCMRSTVVPDWITNTSSKGQSIINIKGDTILFTELDNYSYYRDDLDALLQSDSVIIKFRSFKPEVYIPSENKNELKIDSTTYLYSTANGTKLGELTYYHPQRDYLKYLKNNCCNGIKTATLGCTCEYELCNNYKGYRIVLAYYEKQFKCETKPKKLSFLVYNKEKLKGTFVVSNYKNIEDGYIQYFTTMDAVYLYHYNSNEKNKKGERVLAKFSFNKLIDNIQ